MSVSVIIPAHNEQQFLNKTIQNFLSTADGIVEVIVILNGYEQDVDPRAVVIHNIENKGERVAMNQAARAAKCKYLLRIDAHCDIDKGWDTKLKEAFIGRPNALVVPVLTATDKNWKRLAGHKYMFCKLLPTMEEKWWTKKEYETVEPNMAVTGCGMMMNRIWYNAIGGAEENLPPMGAIGPEFAVKAHLLGDGVFTRTDVYLGHIFATGGYDTSGVAKARAMIKERYGFRYNEIAKKFDMDEGVVRKKTTDNNVRTVNIFRHDKTVTRDSDGEVTRITLKHYVYVYKDDGTGPSVEELEAQYSSAASDLLMTEHFVPDTTGMMQFIRADNHLEKNATSDLVDAFAALGHIIKEKFYEEGDPVSDNDDDLSLVRVPSNREPS